MQSIKLNLLCLYQRFYMLREKILTKTGKQGTEILRRCVRCYLLQQNHCVSKTAYPTALCYSSHLCLLYEIIAEEGDQNSALAQECVTSILLKPAFLPVPLKFHQFDLLQP